MPSLCDSSDDSLAFSHYVYRYEISAWLDREYFSWSCKLPICLFVIFGDYLPHYHFIMWTENHLHLTGMVENGMFCQGLSRKLYNRSIQLWGRRKSCPSIDSERVSVMSVIDVVKLSMFMWEPAPVLGTAVAPQDLVNHGIHVPNSDW